MCAVDDETSAHKSKSAPERSQLEGDRRGFNKVKPRVKRWLRYNCRKPADMSVRAWFCHVQNINDHEIPGLPPFTERDGGKLPDDEMKEILLLGCPKLWQSEMTKQGFDPYEKTQVEMIWFFK